MTDPIRFVLDVSPAARGDIADILRYSLARHGDRAEGRYDALIKQALYDILAEPERPGAKPRPELEAGVYSYHLASSRDRLAGQKVKAPRHIILYRIQGARIEVLRVLHDSRDLARHLPK